MSINVRRHLPLLKFLKIAPPKIVKVILKNADDKFILSICEICYNFCKGNIKCQKKCYNKLKKYRTCLHRLASAKRKQKHYKKEREILYQKGGALLPLLLSPVLTGLTHYFLHKLQ